MFSLTVYLCSLVPHPCSTPFHWQGHPHWPGVKLPLSALNRQIPRLPPPTLNRSSRRTPLGFVPSFLSRRWFCRGPAGPLGSLSLKYGVCRPSIYCRRFAYERRSALFAPLISVTNLADRHRVRSQTPKRPRSRSRTPSAGTNVLNWSWNSPSRGTFKLYTRRRRPER